jgi:(5-formylfuran-3-yl)methyl phosphate synthase
MTQLLVSVRSVAEAAAALAGGAAVIDVKEPTNGSLGRADAGTTADVIRFVAGRRPVSAALGELTEDAAPNIAGLKYVKWGLAGCNGLNWRYELAAARHRLRQMPDYGAPVAAAYVDWERANAPPPQEVAAFAVEQRWPVVLLDTWKKDGASLFDWLAPSCVADLSRRCQADGVRVALAGSLGFDHLELVRDLHPDWLAVRGAVCRSGWRNGIIDPKRIRRLASALATVSLAPANCEDSPLPR